MTAILRTSPYDAVISVDPIATARGGSQANRHTGKNRVDIAKEVGLLEFAAPGPFDQGKQSLGVREVTQQVRLSGHGLHHPVLSRRIVPD